MNQKQEKFKQRKKRVRTKVKGTADRPRLSVFRSNKYLYAQIIDDRQGKTLVAASSREAAASTLKTNMEKADKVGEALAKKALKAKIKKVTFDRSGYQYHGIIKALAEGARKGGLEF
ncbi:MAG: 50S ribosomal protein L18 [Candidatus Woesebacteria bacterium GW2011_GWC2_47_16]|uniref:Large ribosomal subunit protein uL18 n=7 Tax=Candidatus Woeseibacteriota TaxID=1752722 RepID=A0A0G1QPP6_9BACT|nr:MAG: 50S ribosomal protein L18 [Candidatus Woesebacteria bacterium GW2011_GWE1_45_18]KKU23848.1 MAG: 50S ribosomal protein L18 [Candidatus Woesebacteria bacterium GW2011_GWF1_46_13]KKU46986.1 MAG: 50S ribosomal protein L18 [Candidatus Woesebacteria bacterium GW2011_GWF2_46_8]KKU64488.1 MAG: 50S ribosomal protein L18 [Candidatus Woesebacteria bacterium GW2011_GWC2_47_16]OGM78788.1 MAG: 50S ribosomal protein L18 [Candidatus Woesebacteria bacterium RIFOXYA1_FULL_48_16]OGM83200.1 MAG: 50S ribos